MFEHSVRCLAFVGRRAELAALDEARKALAKSSGSFVVISGEAGIGKTRLLAEFLGRSRDRRPRNVVSTECLQRAQQPLGPIRSLVRALAPLVVPADMPPTVRSALAQVIPEELPQDLLAESSRFVLEKDQLFTALFAFLRIICAKRATLISIEDLHWSDESTLEFLAYLVHRMGPTRLLVVATFRSDELERDEKLLASMAPLLREPNTHHLNLEPLAPEEIRAIVDGMLDGKGRLPESVIRDIEQRSEGNPFFAEELVKHYLELGAPEPVAAHLPLSIRASITQRLVNLGPDERKVLAHAAVLGQRFDPAVLAVVMGRDLDSLLPTLSHAQALDLLVDDGWKRLSCRFRHALTRQAIYDSVPSFEARKLHSTILATLEGNVEADRFIEELAYHAWASCDAAKTLRYNERAGDAAFSLRALPEAMICYERAYEAAVDQDDRARLLGLIGAIQRSQGHSQAALDVLEAALTIRLERGEIDAAGLLVASIAGQRYNLGDRDALPYAEDFVEEHGALMSDAARDNLLVITARIACAFCDFRAAQRLLDLVSNPEALAPGARQNYLIAQLMRHAYADAVDRWNQAALQVEQLLPRLTPEAIVSVEAALAMTGIYIGTNAQIERALERAERLEREWGFRGQRLCALAAKAAYLFQRGRLDAARICVQEVARHQDFHPARRVGAMVAAHLATAFGDDTLWKLFDPEVLREAREQLDDPDCIYILGAYAALSAISGSLEEAQRDLRSAIGSLTYSSPEAMYVVINAARFLPVGELSRVRDLIEASAQPGGKATSANHKLVRAMIASRLSNVAEARAAGADAAQLYAALDWPMLEAQALELAGKAELARAIYERCGATAGVRRLSDPEGSPRAGIGSLSSRESEVATLVARGLRNSEIAKRLGIGSKTVEKHVASVFGKLELRSRSEVVAFMARSLRERGPR